MHGLSAFEVNLLDELCRAKVTLSSVRLASDLYDRGALRDVGDPVGWIELALDILNERGFIVMRKRTEYAPSVDIRVTRPGYHAAGYTTEYLEVGRPRKRRLSSDDGGRAHPGDATDFMNLAQHTWGGPIQREPIDQHAIDHPDHPEHARQLREYHGMPAPIDPAVIDAIAIDLSANKPVSRIAASRGVSDATVRNIAAALERVDRSGIRERVLSFIVNHGPLATHRDILQTDTAAGYHETVHVCFRLRRQGLVTFRDVKQGNVTMLRDIRATERGRQLIYTPRSTDDVKIVMPKEAAKVSLKDIPADSPVLATAAERVPALIHTDPQRVYGIREDGRHDLEPEILRGMPALQELMARDRAFEPTRQAAKLLEQAGQQALATMVREEVGELTDEQRQMVSFIKQEIAHRAQEG
jgi:hypothetical protein